MKAIIQTRYGDANALQLVAVEKPVPKDKEILIEIHATNISSGDMRINTLDVPNLLKPLFHMVFGFKGPRRKIRGITAAGRVKEVGKKVSKFAVGDDVYFINSLKAGCLAEYIVLKESNVIAKMPSSISYEEAAPLAFGAMSAFHFINSKTIHLNDKVLIYGASGSLGTYAIQLAKYYGAEVTAVSSAKNIGVSLSLGADYVIDYQTTNFWEDSKSYDMIFDTVSKLSKKVVKNVLSDKGKYVSTRMPTSEKVHRLHIINEIIQSNGLTSYIEKAYPFGEYKEAHHHVYTKHKVGNVVLKIQ